MRRCSTFKVAKIFRVCNKNDFLRLFVYLLNWFSWTLLLCIINLWFFLLMENHVFVWLYDTKGELQQQKKWCNERRTANYSKLDLLQMLLSFGLLISIYNVSMWRKPLSHFFCCCCFSYEIIFCIIIATSHFSTPSQLIAVLTSSTT